MTNEKIIKEWYEDPDMVGKPVWVRDGVNSYWSIDIFMSYVDGADFPFYTNFDYYKQAKPVKPEECYQGVQDDNS